MIFMLNKASVHSVKLISACAGDTTTQRPVCVKLYRYERIHPALINIGDSKFI